MDKDRLDKLCVERGLAGSRQRAQALIAAGEVLVNGLPVTKSGSLVARGADLRVRGAPMPYVSRGGLKLAAALDHVGLVCTDKVALDVGASTGGFTDCLLQRGARHVVAVDVGYGQLAWSLRQDARVTVMERTNARYLDPERVRQSLPAGVAFPPALAAVDVSFISLTLVLPALVRCLAPRAHLVALIKPQFEAGRGAVGHGGVVRNEHARAGAIAKVIDWARAEGYKIIGGLDSPVIGPKGNVEYLLIVETPT